MTSSKAQLHAGNGDISHRDHPLHERVVELIELPSVPTDVKADLTPGTEQLSKSVKAGHDAMTARTEEAYDEAEEVMLGAPFQEVHHHEQYTTKVAEKTNSALDEMPSEQADENPLCHSWALAQECIRNPQFMCRHTVFAPRLRPVRCSEGRRMRS